MLWPQSPSLCPFLWLVYMLGWLEPAGPSLKSSKGMAAGLTMVACEAERLRWICFENVS